MAETENSEMITDLGAAVLREQVRLIMRQVPTMQTAALVVALVLCYTVRHIVSFPAMFLWFSLVLAVALGRFVLFGLFKRVRSEDFDGAHWKKAYLILALVSGIAWGSSAFLVFPSGDTALISLFVLVMATLAAATSVSHSSIKAGPAAWMTPVLLLYTLRCVMEWREPENTIGFLIIVYLITLLRYSFHQHDVITESLSLKFENLRLLDEVRAANDVLRRMSSQDGLTGLANRRSFDEFLEREWHRAARNKTPLAVLMLDIDHFKLFNDNYGHQAGDDCLRKAAETIRQALRRTSDFAARYGGEEFVVVLPDTDKRGTAEMAEKLRSGIAAMGVPHAYSSSADVVTASVGGASLVPYEGLAPAELIRLVDTAMYAAKQAGRNKVKVV